MVITLLAAAASSLAVIVLVKWLLSDNRKPPGPWGLPIVGYIPFLSRLPFLDFQRLGNKYGNLFSIRLGSQRVVVLNGFEATKDAFSRDAFIGRPPLMPFLFNEETIKSGAFTGLPWKEQRRFSLHMLRDLGFGKSKMEDHIQEEILILMHRIESNMNKPFIIRHVLGASTSNNVGAFLTGKRLDYNDPIRKLLTKFISRASETGGQVSWPLFFPWIMSLLQILRVGEIDTHLKSMTYVRSYIWEEIENHEKTLDRNNIRDYIDGYLLEIEKRKNDPSFSKHVLQDLTVGFFGAGSDTVRVSVEWLLLRVASCMQGQRRIQAEIDETIGPNRFPIWQDQKNMPYTQAFIMELMRWRTIIPLNVLRYTIADTKLNGFFIPKHTYIVSNLWAVHHDPEYWGEDVEEFRPERFLTEDEKNVKKPEYYVPFSIGKRACPGEPLANIEVFLYFVAILQKFNLRLPAGKTADFEGMLGISLQSKAQEIIFTARNSTN